MLLVHLCPTCGPVSVFAVVQATYMLTTCPYCDNLKIDIFDAGGLQCHFITSVLRTGSFPYVLLAFWFLPLFH